MCEFCHKHGDGKKWYLQAKNCSMDLLRDVERKKFMQEFVTFAVEEGRGLPGKWEGCATAIGRGVSPCAPWSAAWAPSSARNISPR